MATGGSVDTGVVLGGVVVALVSVLSGFALTRGAKRTDTDLDHARDLARHDGRLLNIEETVHRLEGLQRATGETIQSIVLQVASLQQTLKTRPSFDARASLLVEDIRRLTEAIKQAQTVDHTLLTTLHERVRALELLTNPKYVSTGEDT